MERFMANKDLTYAASGVDTAKGAVKKKVSERGFGFIHADDGKDYFFHLADLQVGLGFDDIEEGLQVDFEIRKESNHDKAGAAQNVRRHGE